MTNEEAKKLLLSLSAAYPNAPRQNQESQATIWAELFSDDDAQDVANAAYRHIATCKYYPTIAEIRGIMADVKHPELIPPDVAWEAVSCALDAHSMYDAQTELSGALPPLVARAVDSVGADLLYALRRSEEVGRDRRAFMDVYVPIYTRARRNAMTPKAIRRIINCDSEDAKKVREARAEKKRKEEQFWLLINSQRRL